MVYSHGSTDLAMAVGKFSPIERSIPKQLSRLLFADDVLIFCQANKASFKEIDHLLDILQLNAGLLLIEQKASYFLVEVVSIRISYQISLGFQ